MMAAGGVPSCSCAAAAMSPGRPSWVALVRFARSPRRAWRRRSSGSRWASSPSSRCSPRETGAGQHCFAVRAVTTLAKDGSSCSSGARPRDRARWPSGRPSAIAPGSRRRCRRCPPAVPARVVDAPSPRVPAPGTRSSRAALDTLREVWVPTALAALEASCRWPSSAPPFPQGRAYLRRYGLSLGLLVAVAFLAWLNVPSREPVPFGENFERILVYAVLPARRFRAHRPRPFPAQPGRAAPAASVALRGPQPVPAPPGAGGDGAPVPAPPTATGASTSAVPRGCPLVLAVCRETRRTAAHALMAGDEVVFDPASRRFTRDDLTTQSGGCAGFSWRGLG